MKDLAADTWPAPTPRRPVIATVSLPGSKSLTNRYLLLAATASSTSVVRGVLRARDTDLMIEALRRLGTGIEEIDPGTHDDDVTSTEDLVIDAGGNATHAPTLLRITPAPPRGPATIDAGLAGTVLRFVPAWAAGARGDVTFTGDEQATGRPIAPLLAALRELGATIAGDGLPFTIHGNGPIPGGRVAIDASASSQFVSALLLGGTTMVRGVTVVPLGRTPSLPHIDMTIKALREFGVAAGREDAAWYVRPGTVSGRDLAVEPDLSNAAVFLAAAAVTGGRVRIVHWPTHTAQAGSHAPQLLASMGARIEHGTGWLTVEGAGTLHGIEADMSGVGELVPAFAAVAALASSPSRFYGIGHLRGHETDRLAAIVTEINALGGVARAGDDDLTIERGPTHGGVVRCYADHRMAMFGAILGLVIPGISLDDVGATTKTLPGFTEAWTRAVTGA